MQIPGWFRAVFVTVMLALCIVACWYCLSVTSLKAQRTELEMMLDTSRQREVKQQVEYDAVSAELPQVQEELAAIQPEADAAKAIETDLRSQRKQLRSEVAATTAVVEQLRTVNEELWALWRKTSEILLLTQGE